MLQSFFVGDKLLGSRSAPSVQLDRGHWAHPLSRALLCPHCGRVWARIEVSNSRWSPIVASCANHGPLPETQFPGSLLIPGFPELGGPDLPLAVLAYEFQQALRAYDLKKEEDEKAA